MKKQLAILACLAMIGTGALAQAQGADASSESISRSSAQNAGNSQNITFTSPADSKTEVHYSGSQTIRNVPSVIGPALVSSNDTCMGSASGGIAGPGFGIALGKTYKDENCVRLKNARELWNMGMKAASMALMCLDDENRAALTVTGYACPLGGPPPKYSSADDSKQEYTDPYVRSRLGLAPLK